MDQSPLQGIGEKLLLYEEKVVTSNDIDEGELLVEGSQFRPLQGPYAPAELS